MDVEDLDGTLKEVHRVLKPKGKEQPGSKRTEDIEGLISDYYNPQE